MLEDGDLIHDSHLSADHPAHFDQQVTKIQELLPTAKAFVVCLLVPKEDGVGEMHVVIGETPGVSTIKFLSLALRDIAETANNFLVEEGKK